MHDQVAFVAAVARKDRDPGRELDRHGRETGFGLLFQLSFDAVEQHLRAGLVGLRQDDEELVASVAARNVRAAQAQAERRRDNAQHFVTRLMAEVVVVVVRNALAEDDLKHQIVVFASPYA